MDFSLRDLGAFIGSGPCVDQRMVSHVRHEEVSLTAPIALIARAMRKYWTAMQNRHLRRGGCDTVLERDPIKLDQFDR
jgi:hypothetical protein